MVNNDKMIQIQDDVSNLIQIGGLPSTTFIREKRVLQGLASGHSEAMKRLANKFRFEFYSSEHLLEIAKGKVRTPKDANEYSYVRYPHWHAFRIIHIGASTNKLGLAIVLDNLKIVASIPDDRIREIRMSEILALGINNGL